MDSLIELLEKASAIVAVAAGHDMSEEEAILKLEVLKNIVEDRLLSTDDEKRTLKTLDNLMDAVKSSALSEEYFDEEQG